ncbi:MAG: radical SAM protein [Pirellulales bacterium]
MPIHRAKVLLVQLPIPPAGAEPVRGNVPLAAGYLKMLALGAGLGERFEIEMLEPALANDLGDAALVREIVDRRPDLLGFTCYLWNVERSLWLAEQVKARRPQTQVLVGGPEATLDNRWVLDHPAVDFAAVGEGEQTFVELLAALAAGDLARPIDGLFVSPRLDGPTHPPAFRQPLPNLNGISSPYLAGILDAGQEQMLLLETIRGCIFKCKFCYYPKSYDDLYFLSEEKIVANLRHARERGAREVVLLDPTLNQRKNFADFVRLLGRENPGRQFTYFGELRAEGITPEIAGLLAEAGFDEVEIGLQSIDPAVQELMDRRNNMRAFERGVRAMIEAGLKVKVDLIIGLPGDTEASVRRGLAYLRDERLYTELQVFHLAILPGTAFRQEAEALGLRFQPRPPYYVLETPTLDMAAMSGLMEEAETSFGVEFDPLPAPRLEFLPADEPGRMLRVDLDAPLAALYTPEAQAQAYTLWLKSADFDARREAAAAQVRQLLAACPFTTLSVALEPTGDPRRLTARTLEAIRREFYARPTYLDHFYAVQPGPAKGAKRQVIVLPEGGANLGEEMVSEWEEYGEVVGTHLARGIRHGVAL